MQLFGLICVAAYCLAATLVGVRLLRLARRTREVPELMIGACFLFGGSIGYPASVAALLLSERASALAGPVAATGSIGLALAAACMLVAWWRIYHPASRSAPWVVCVWGGLLVLVLVPQLGQTMTETAPGVSPWGSLRVVVQGGAYAAIAWSGIRYYSLLRRRLSVGLADPVVVNRILLWNVAASAVTLQYSYAFATPWLNSLFDATKLAPAFTGMLGLVIALSITHAFYPPRGYLRWIEKQTERQAG
jgi:hypothetical protein